MVSAEFCENDDQFMFVVSVLVDKELLDGARQGPRRGSGAQGLFPENCSQPEKTSGAKRKSSGKYLKLCKSNPR